MSCSAPPTLMKINACGGRRVPLFLGVTLGVQLLDVGPQVVDFLLVLDASEDHFGAGDLGPWILDVFLEVRLVPNDAGILVGAGIVEARNGAGLAAVEAVELRADLVLRAGADA